mmetsp:Transcript_130385/g.363267  ORF Transcript_130385/g.363267 Transcript_130385/m.363267 type:complete len:533 (-) Transcript_130385:18-1616(-)
MVECPFRIAQVCEDHCDLSNIRTHLVFINSACTVQAALLHQGIGEFFMDGSQTHQDLGDLQMVFTVLSLCTCKKAFPFSFQLSCLLNCGGYIRLQHIKPIIPDDVQRLFTTSVLVLVLFSPLLLLLLLLFWGHPVLKLLLTQQLWEGCITDDHGRRARVEAARDPRPQARALRGAPASRRQQLPHTEWRRELAEHRCHILGFAPTREAQHLLLPSCQAASKLCGCRMHPLQRLPRRVHLGLQLRALVMCFRGPYHSAFGKTVGRSEGLRKFLHGAWVQRGVRLHWDLWFGDVVDIHWQRSLRPQTLGMACNTISKLIDDRPQRCSTEARGIKHEGLADCLQAEALTSPIARMEGDQHHSRTWPAGWHLNAHPAKDPLLRPPLQLTAANSLVRQIHNAGASGVRRQTRGGRRLRGDISHNHKQQLSDAVVQPRKTEAESSSTGRELQDNPVGICEAARPHHSNDHILLTQEHTGAVCASPSIPVNTAIKLVPAEDVGKVETVPRMKPTGIIRHRGCRFGTRLPVETKHQSRTK